MCVPRILRNSVMWYLHDAKTAGHMGIRRTISKLMNSQYYWPRMKQYAQDYLSACDICEERKNPTWKKRSYMKSYLSGERFQRIATDIAGPFTKKMDICTFLLCLTILQSYVNFILYETWKLKQWPKLYSNDGLSDTDVR